MTSEQWITSLQACNDHFRSFLSCFIALYILKKYWGVHKSQKLFLHLDILTLDFIALINTAWSDLMTNDIFKRGWKSGYKLIEVVGIDGKVHTGQGLITSKKHSLFWEENMGKKFDLTLSRTPTPCPATTTGSGSRSCWWTALSRLFLLLFFWMFNFSSLHPAHGMAHYVLCWYSEPSFAF